MLTFVEETEGRVVWSIKVLEEERFTVDRVYGDMISTVMINARENETAEENEGA